MHYLLTAVFLVSLQLAPSAWAGAIYKCKNAQGNLLYQEKPCAEETQSVSVLTSAAEGKMQDDSGSSAPLVIGQGNNGHYMVKGSVNDQDLIFMVDTGASYVTLPQWVGTSAGAKCMARGTVHTGNGISKVCTTIIKKLKFGTFTLTDVEALIAPNLNEPLLGMNVLKRFRVEQDSGEMRLSRKF